MTERCEYGRLYCLFLDYQLMFRAEYTPQKSLVPTNLLPALNKNDRMFSIL
jgi:hypothetical protein